MIMTDKVENDDNKYYPYVEDGYNDHYHIVDDSYPDIIIKKMILKIIIILQSY